MSASVLSEVQIGAARAMLVDAVTAEVVSALRAAGVRSLLLKGPALGAWMYDGGLERTYDDVDLLISPDDGRVARDVLAALGFRAGDDALSAKSLERLVALGEMAPHAIDFVRDRPPVAVDLHHTIYDASADRRTIWAAMSADAEPRELRGVTVEIPSRAARALIVALHAAWHGPVHDRVNEDLERAIERVPERAWRDAAARAARIGALDSLSAGLRLGRRGEELAEALELPSRVDRRIALQAAGAPPTAMGFERLAATRGLRARARLVAGELVPPPVFMRHSSPLARRGSLGLAAAYARRPFWLARHAGAGLVAWRRAQRRTKKVRP